MSCMLLPDQAAGGESAAACMAAHRRTIHPSLWILLFFLFLKPYQAIAAADAISKRQSLSGNQTIVSTGGNFELGFFSPGNSQARNYYIGIWYMKVSEKTVIWVANRGVPISDPSTAELKISDDGNIVLLDNTKTQIWSSNSTSPATNSRVATLQDTGNLLLADRRNASAVAWQSFDHPTDTWVPEAWLGINKITGEYQTLTSWKSKEDPSPGPFSISIDLNGSTQFFAKWNGSQKYWTSGEWNKETQIFNQIPEMRSRSNYNFTFVETKERKYFTYTVYYTFIITRTVMDLSGQLKQFIWLNNTKEWILFLSQPKVQCDVYSLCRSFGVCYEESMPSCRCMQGFEPTSAMEWSSSDWRHGCKRKSTLQCDNNGSMKKEDKYLTMPHMRLPANSQRLEAGSARECELACLGNCTCTAYSYERSCSIWLGDLRDLRQLSAGDSAAHTLYLKLAASEFPSPWNKTRITTKIVIRSIAGLILVLLIVIVVATWRCTRSTGEVKLAEGTLVAFKYRDLQNVTKNFTEKIGGGGFGSVFKGMLPGSTGIAVKKLEGLAGLLHGDKQCRTELSTLGMVQHVNLVRLRGFCIEGPEKLVVYDYMPMGSLDAHLFRGNSNNLAWKTRYQIILGVAKGLAYLHDKCRQCIMHLDIKPENILLDEDFCPKIADFGMAKLLGRDFSRVLTTMRGTRGYLAPEWISGLPITPKADVYSYGMMLFELISGKRNTDQTQMRNVGFYPVWAVIKVNEGHSLDLLDENIEGAADMEELDKACRVACWCIQDCEAHRPSMGQVVQILEGFQR